MTTPLAAILAEKIAASGPLTVEEYMEACLYHPQYGYYTNGYNFLPAPTGNGAPYPHDFTTAPEISPLFGATLANWVARQATTLPKATPFTLMECGPGRGSLMLGLLTHLQIAHPQVFANAQPMLIETSPTLTALQQHTLQAFPHCKWSTTPESPLPTILIGNEILDAFPHSQLIEHEGRIVPRTIESEGHTFRFTQPEGRITEHSPQMRTWLQALPQSLHAAIFLDYGAATSGPTGDTFQAIHRHHKVSPFHLPGETDLTMHVNFTNVVAALKESHPHLQAESLDALTAFLMHHGLASLALADGPHPEMENMLHRLLHPTQMGTLFKVQVFTCSTHIRP